MKALFRRLVNSVSNIFFSFCAGSLDNLSDVIELWPDNIKILPADVIAILSNVSEILPDVTYEYILSLN